MKGSKGPRRRKSGVKKNYDEKTGRKKGDNLTEKMGVK